MPAQQRPQSDSNKLAPGKAGRAYGAGRFALEFDGKGFVGVLNSADGGQFKAESIGDQVGAEGLVTRYPGRQKFEDITLQVGTTMTGEFWKWIEASINNKYERRSGAIVAYDFDGNERARRTFREALIAEIGFPALDAKSKTPASVSVKITPEFLEFSQSGGGGKLKAGEIAKQKHYVPSNFRVSLERFKDVTRMITKVEALTIKQNIIVNPIGNELWPRQEVGRIEMPTLSITLPENNIKPFMIWYQEFVGLGKHDHSRETTGALEFLSNDLQRALMTLSFDGLGITGVTLDKHDAGADAIRMARVDMYIENMKFEAHG